MRIRRMRRITKFPSPVRGLGRFYLQVLSNPGKVLSVVERDSGARVSLHRGLGGF